MNKMINMKKILICSLLAAVSVISCKRTEIPTTSQGDGKLTFNLTSETDYILVRSSVDYTDFSNYDVVINGPVIIREKYSEFAGKVVELGSGTYTITVTSPDTAPAAFEQPIYQAVDEFQIRAGEVTALDLVCRPANCKVTIELSDNFKKELSTYEVVIGNGVGQLVWTKDATKNDFADNKAGYFDPRGLEVKVKGHRSIDNSEATAVYYVKNPLPGDHHVIKLDAKVTGTIGGIQIGVRDDFNEIFNDIEIGGIDESYVDRPDFDGDDSGDEEEITNNNKIIWEANPTFQPIDITSSSQISMIISMPAGIETFVVNVSDNFKPAVSVITDGGVDYIDLINDARIEAEFGGDKSALPTGPQIYQQTEVVFDLTSFVGILCATAKGMDVSFILEATDANGQPLLFMDDYPTVTLRIPE